MAGPAAGCPRCARDIETRLRRQGLPSKTGRILPPRNNPKTQRLLPGSIANSVLHLCTTSVPVIKDDRWYTTDLSRPRIVNHNNLQVVLSNLRRAFRRFCDYWYTMEIDTRFPTKLQTVSDAPEPFRTSLADNISSGELLMMPVVAPRRVPLCLSLQVVAHLLGETPGHSCVPSLLG